MRSLFKCKKCGKRHNVDFGSILIWLGGLYGAFVISIIVLAYGWGVYLPKIYYRLSFTSLVIFAIGIAIVALKEK